MLVLFDVDGTLIQSTAIDADVYARTFAAVFGTELPSTEWGTYLCATDRGVAEEAVRTLGLDPALIPEFQQRFVAGLVLEAGTRGVEPVRGARDVPHRLGEAGHTVALATGAWERAARVKLRAARIPVEGHLLVGSDAHVAREEIIREALQRAGPAARRAVYVGDGVWDLRAARALRLPFVGVEPEGCGILRGAGAASVVRDFQRFPEFLRILEQAAPPSAESTPG
ncbi:MAG TPA: HAD family hydrolase [Anaeromyxobacteraceae bacterium]|nr:HAD family hydrolase [Anaeromyxobacteraceae bacterium]